MEPWQNADVCTTLAQEIVSSQRALGQMNSSSVCCLLKAAAWEWRTGRAGQPLGSVVCVITCSQRNHIVIPKGDSGQAFHLKTVILQMFNYSSNAKDDCKCAICPVRSYQP